MITYLIIGVIGFLIYWVLIKDGSFKQGVGELRNGKVIEAYNSFHKVIRKNPKHYHAEFHLGLCCREMAKLHEPTDKTHRTFKLEALEHFIRVLEIEPNYGKADNLIEVLIGSETDIKLKEEMEKSLRKIPN